MLRRAWLALGVGVVLFAVVVVATPRERFAAFGAYAVLLDVWSKSLKPA